MRAREPDHDGVVERDGVGVGYAVFGEGEPTILLFTGKLPGSPCLQAWGGMGVP